jgi:hypothetical protein
MAVIKTEITVPTQNAMLPRSLANSKTRFSFLPICFQLAIENAVHVI